MSSRAVFIIAALALGCAFPVPKSRIEPQERVLIELRSEDAPSIHLPSGSLAEPEIERRFEALIKQQLVRRRSLAPSRSRADALLAVRLVSISLADKSADAAALRITAAARVETGGEDPAKPRSPWHAAEYESPAQPHSAWSASDGKMLDEQLELGLGRIADELVAGSLRAKETK
ncbi:MAG: hypothetical protein ACRDMZ_13830 [Solirubrobacteraceae bacterium]